MRTRYVTSNGRSARSHIASSEEVPLFRGMLALVPPGQLSALDRVRQSATVRLIVREALREKEPRQ